MRNPVARAAANYYFQVAGRVGPAHDSPMSGQHRKCEHADPTKSRESAPAQSGSDVGEDGLDHVGRELDGNVPM
jgi:hypothetical protein